MGKRAAKQKTFICEIIFTGPSSPHYYEVIRGPYEKGSYTCFTLAEVDKNGDHIIRKHRTGTIFSIAHPHLYHQGTTIPNRGEKA